jgi:alkylated DNA repair dioxygenase AlkB
MRRLDLKDGAWLELEEDWISPEEATALLQALIDEEPWEQRPIMVFGREIMQPRLISWAGELPYRYSGQTLPPRTPSPRLAGLLEQLSARCGVTFNHVLLNRYRDGSDHMSRHSDDEPELGRNPVIAAISLGAPRRFHLEHKRKRSLKRHVRLTHGSLMVMGGSMQHTWRHAVPKMASITEERINLTLRCLRGPPGWRQAGEPRPPREEREPTEAIP